MASKVEICNLALAHLGQKNGIVSFTERSNAANTCNQFYDTVRNLVLRSFPWSFATKIVSLALVEEDPNEEWLYSYRTPTDCLQTRKIQSGTVNDTNETEIKFRNSSDDTGDLILTNKEDAILEYTKIVEESEQFPPDFTMALSALLAFYMAPAIAGQDPFKLGDRALAIYNGVIGKAESKSLNEEVNDTAPESEFIRERM